MPDVHAIRLRGPWMMVLGDRSGPIAKDEASRRVKFPARKSEVLEESYAGRARFERHFGAPTAIEPHEKVWLLIDTPHDLAGGLLNELSLEFGKIGHADPRYETEITSRLITRNRLALEIEFGPGGPVRDGPLLGEVWLEIRSGSG